MTPPARCLYRSLYCGVFLFFAFALVILSPVISDLIASFRVCEVYAAEHGRSPTVTAPSSGRVAWVIDGDTAVLDSGEKVRYLGIDTPEQGEPFYDEAKARNKAIAEGRPVRLEVCKESPYDKYGRLLAYVYVDGKDISATLLREGLARQLVIPPCGLSRAAELKGAVSSAIANGIGVWSAAGRAGAGGVKVVDISPGQALEYIGAAAMVTGKVFNVHRTKKAAFINFGPDWHSAFTAVIFADNLGAFKAAGIDIMRYKGRDVSVTGTIRLYGERAEIIVSRPSQIKGD